jgi:hypothetical protein
MNTDIYANRAVYIRFEISNLNKDIILVSIFHEERVKLGDKSRLGVFKTKCEVLDYSIERRRHGPFDITSVKYAKVKIKVERTDLD